jgi:hypothetical protein
MKFEKLVLFLLGFIIVILLALAFDRIVFTDKYTYQNIQLPANASIAGICKDGKVLEGLRCDPEITCCK